MTQEIDTIRTRLSKPLAKLMAMQRPYEIGDPSTGMHFEQQSKYVTWKFTTKQFPDGIEVLHITDTQFGHIMCQDKRIVEYRDWVLAAKNRFVFFGGDMVDAATRVSIGSPFENICDAQGQIYRFCEIMAPMRHRILGFVGGNHERRGVPTFGDLGSLLAFLMNIPYSNGQQLIDLQYGDWKPFKVHLFHGKGAAQTKGAKVMMLQKFIYENPGSDLYLVGHLHDCFILPLIRTERVIGENRVKMKKYYGGMSSSFLETWGTYAEVSGMSPTDVLMLRTIIEPNGKSEMTIR